MARQKTRQRKPFVLFRLDEYLTHAVGLLEVMGYEVRSLNVTQQGGNRVLVRFKLNPPPPGRGHDRWEWQECAATDKGAQQCYDMDKHRFVDKWRKSVHVERGFSSIGGYAGTTPRLGPAGLLEYINTLPWVTAEEG